MSGTALDGLFDRCKIILKDFNDVVCRVIFDDARALG